MQMSACMYLQNLFYGHLMVQQILHSFFGNNEHPEAKILAAWDVFLLKVKCVRYRGI